MGTEGGAPRILVLTAAMGAGHDHVAAELARRLRREGVEVTVRDVLGLLPLGLGTGLRRFYGCMIHTMPWLYAGIYRIFFRSRHAPSSSPLAALIAVRLEELTRQRPPDAVVSTFHLAGQAAGRLRAAGRLDAPVFAVVTDFAVHRMWLHPGIDHYLCPDRVSARAAQAATGRPATACAPLVGPEFAERGCAPDGRLVLVSAGAWGAGDLEATARLLAGSGRYHPLVLCGGNRHLLERLRRTPGCSAVGWRDDIADLMARAYALIDNAGGLTCREAFAVGLPVVSYRPIPGHGREGVEAMHHTGLTTFARTGRDLLRALDALADESRRRSHTAAGRRLFAAPAADQVITVAIAKDARRLMSYQ